MRAVAIVLILTATPAVAHNEVVMVTSMLPLMMGIATISSVAIGALWNKWRRK